MKTLLFSAVAMTAPSAGTGFAEEDGRNTINRRLSGVGHSPNAPTRDSESELPPGGNIMRRFLFLAVGLGLATSCGAACGHTQTLHREDNIWGGYDHQPTQSEVTQQERSAGIAASRQEQQSADDDVEHIYRGLMGQPPPPLS